MFVRYTESSSFPMDDTFYIIIFVAYNNIHGHFLFGVCLTEMFVIVGSVILRFHCTSK